MKNIFLILAFVCSVAVAQTATHPDSYTLTNTDGITNLSEYHTAVQSTNWSNYRLQNAEVTIDFSSGVKLVLKSGVQLKALGLVNTEKMFQEQFPNGYKLPVAELHAGGKIALKVTASSKK